MSLRNRRRAYCGTMVSISIYIKCLNFQILFYPVTYAALSVEKAKFVVVLIYLEGFCKIEIYTIELPFFLKPSLQF